MRCNIRVRIQPILVAAVILSAVLGSAACSSGAAALAEKEQTEMDILHSTMSYIGSHHADAAAFIPADISFNQLPHDQRKVGYGSVTYTGGGWEVSIGHAITLDEIYDMRADYQSGKIVWIGRSQDSVITEDSYTKAE